MITIPGHSIVAHVRTKLIQHVYIPCNVKDRLLGWGILHTIATLSQWPFLKAKPLRKSTHTHTKCKIKNVPLHRSWKEALFIECKAKQGRERVSWLQICWGHAQWVNALFSAPCHESYGLQTWRKWNTFLSVLGDFEQCVFIIVSPHTLPTSYLSYSYFFPLSLKKFQSPF